MKSKPKTDPRATAAKKDFWAVLDNFLANNLPQLGGELTRKPVVEAIIALFDEYCLPAERMKAGEVLWYAVDQSETGGYGKPLEKSQLKPVVLSLVHRDDIERIKEGLSRRERSIHTAVRLFEEAFKQGGVMTGADVASIMRLSPGTVSGYVREFERDHDKVVPRRGTIHDMGPTLTHKRIICLKHFVEGKTIEQTARETHHSTAAVTRYVNAYKRVLTCWKQGLSKEDTRAATGLSKGLIQQYLDLIDQHVNQANRND